jgi:outer membrane protein OmpA-like peptidoglycan-associated protein
MLRVRGESDWMGIDSTAPLLLSVHGIRTTGRWQKQLTEAAEEAGVRYRPLDFGYFMALSLLWPSSRKKKVEWFREECESLCRGLAPGQRASIVAHSFGTYLVTAALAKYSDMRFDRVILCGSIVRTDYPWTSIIAKRGQVNSVLNEVGGKDFWAAFVSWVVADAGPSGVTGFDDLADGAVRQRIHPEHRHSDFFYSTNYREVWLPFIRGQGLSEVVAMEPPRTNWRFVTTAFIALTILALLAFAGRDRLSFWKGSDQTGTALELEREPKVAKPGSRAVDPRPSEGNCASQDGDGDGVNNCADKCPGSEPGQVIDATGCVPPKPLELGVVNFDPDMAMYRQDQLPILDEAVEMLTRYPEYRVEIAGHTRSTGSQEYNQGLSMRRAQAVFDYLQTRGVSTTQVVALNGYGEARPLVPETNADGSVNVDGLRKNDRVELNVQPLETAPAGNGG